VGGEIVPTPRHGPRHEAIRGKLTMRLARQAPDSLFVVSKGQFNLADDTYLRPDTLVHAVAKQTYDIRGCDALLAVEVADDSDSSLYYDLDIKAPIYAAHGVCEYWVIDAGTLVTRVHRKPSGNAWESVEEVTPGETLIPLLVPVFSVSLGPLQNRLG
jgi:Uma2 family endonuclease